MKGYVQVYTGDGKGKTTASIGLAIRAAGAGLNVFIAQFLKQGDYSEIRALSRFSDRITIEQFGLGGFIVGEPSPEDIQAAMNGLNRAKEVMASGKVDIIILEEANRAASRGLLPVQALLDMIHQKPDSVELVITGREADPAVIEAADLVTEMNCIKHYYQKGVPARTGIEK
ncbi:MAG: cob(I)yrinic acid a,c-diamide adenosyltransferase [Desulfatirhabdiaceae bacterium]